jgi:hypothetical protein
MKRAISYSTAVLWLILLATAPAAAGFGDGSSGSRHSKRNSSGGASSKPIEPSHADLHGATRDSADKAYRKQYGF